jgi:hypothetical protein
MTKYLQKVQSIWSNIVTQLSKNRKVKSRGPFSVPSLLYTHLGRMARAFHKKSRCKTEYRHVSLQTGPKLASCTKKSLTFCAAFSVFSDVAADIRKESKIVQMRNNIPTVQRGQKQV